jgi:hypothetical protein
MLKDLQWFLDREGSYIMRGTTEVFVASEETANKLFEMQGEDYVFSEKLKIHKARPESCPSCEA